MILARLKEYVCPGCRSPLRYSALMELHECTRTNRKDCEFAITDEAFNIQVHALYTPKQREHQPTEEQNLSELNNLGHKVRSEDYSDRQPS